MKHTRSSFKSDKLICPLFLAILCIAFTVVFNIFGYSQAAKLSLADILTGLRSKKVTLPERNKLLIDAVKSRGITFAVTDEIAKELEITGADKMLIQTIKEKAAGKPAGVDAAPEVKKPSLTEAEYLSFQKQGDGFLIKGDYDLAIANYAKAIELNPKVAELYFGRAMSYYNKGVYESAISDFTRGLELAPKETIAYLNRGDSFEKTGNLQKASADYQKVLETAPGNERAKLSLQRTKAEIAKIEQAKAEQIKTEQLKAEQAKPTAQQIKSEKFVETSSKTEASSEPRPSKEKDDVRPDEKKDLGQLTPDKAVNMAQPLYSAEARKFRVSGQVKVIVDIDNTGKVVSAKAVSGSTLLRNSAEKAALASSFSPKKMNLSGRGTGFIIYNFKLN